MQHRSQVFECKFLRCNASTWQPVSYTSTPVNQPVAGRADRTLAMEFEPKSAGRIPGQSVGEFLMESTGWPAVLLNIFKWIRRLDEEMPNLIQKLFLLSFCLMELNSSCSTLCFQKGLFDKKEPMPGLYQSLTISLPSPQKMINSWIMLDWSSL